MSPKVRIALIHATTIAVDPIREALDRDWPACEAINILDDSLSPDRASAGMVSTDLTRRIRELAHYARSIGSQGILFTCSSFGSAIEQAAKELDVPVLKPNEAMFGDAIRAGGRTAMIYTFPPAREGMEEEFREEAARLGSGAEIDSVFVPGAIEAIRAGDAQTHNRLVAEAAAQLKGYASVVLAHFSTARAIEAVRAVTPVPVHSSPEAAVKKLKAILA
ncbi:hypothetical protein SAMN05428969_2014 [Devosia sp. YR412]|uniref:arylsulfatase n=1 Tax=Devosia sp. YR412 TaxID=1881030 RepID=UPI0008D4E471|nr:arylsulfatase [Devosia sp. YR412]SEQ10976.1 hypothetical protein SAMN05428969_2014 [Devosia sp. YR412]